MTPYYEEPGIQIYHADSGEYLSTVHRSFDLILTSPPYNLGGEPWPHLGHWKPGDGTFGSKSKWRNGSDACGGTQYSQYHDAMPHQKYVSWQRAILTSCWEHLTDTGAIFYNHKPRVIGGRLWLPLELNPNLPLRQIIIWARAGGMNYNPTAYVPTHEWILIFAKDRFRLRNKAASGFGDVWYIPQEHHNPHPAPFPLALPDRILTSTRPPTVLDPFMGSGTTLRAAKDHGLSAVGIDIDEQNCELAVERLRQQTLTLIHRIDEHFTQEAIAFED